MSNKKLIIILSFLLLISFTLAQDSLDRAKSEILKIFGNIIRFLFSILMIIGSLLLLILGIFLIVFGKEEYPILGQKINARQAFLYLIFGIVLLVLSFFIPNLIKNFIENSIQ